MFADENALLFVESLGTTVVSMAIVPEVVIVPPVRPVPAVILVTVPVPAVIVSQDNTPDAPTLRNCPVEPTDDGNVHITLVEIVSGALNPT